MSTVRQRDGKAATSTSQAVGRVYLVGAGPGDPELMTLRAARLLAQAEVLVYDRLVSDAVLSAVPAGVKRIYVGKAADRHALSQDEINALLVQLARTGRDVVRLKGGDPFIFGRGGEEAAYLQRHGIAWEVVPGVTAAAGCGAALGIPLTHRGVATGVRFVTGHYQGDAPLDLNWSSLADASTTLAVYMGLANIGLLQHELQAAGRCGQTPVLAVASGTTPQQRLCRTTLARLAEDVAAEALRPPVMLLIGEVVAAAEQLGIAQDCPAQAAEVAQHG
jgi:uroporphyrin-III C-methyltransferase